MSLSRRQADKQKKQRQRKQRKAESQARARHSSPPAPHLPELPRIVSRPKPVQEALSPVDQWWEAYENADGQERVRMTREKLATVSPSDDSFDRFFPESIDELQTKLSRPEYAVFLEQLRGEYPDVFAASLDWNTRSLVFHYIPEGRMADVNRAVDYLAEQMEEISEPIFSLISMIRLAGGVQAAQRLVDAAMALARGPRLLPWAVDELIEWALFGPVQACVSAGATDEAIEAFYQKSLELGVEDTKSARQTQRKHVAHIAGTSGKVWTRDELLAARKDAGREFHALLYDYMRWLCRQRGFHPIVADELRRVLADTINHMENKPTALLRGLRQRDFEPALTQKLGFLSLETFHAPAAVVAMRHFYDFLHAHDLVDQRTCDTAHSVCYILWKKLKTAMARNWDECRFLEAYLPAPTIATSG